MRAVVPQGLRAHRRRPPAPSSIAAILISAKDLGGARPARRRSPSAGIGCLKVEGRKKKPEYVATVTHGYRELLDRLERGERDAADVEEVQPLVQIFSRGFTGGMYGGRAGRDYITRTQPDNRGVALGVVVGREGGELIVDVTHAGRRRRWPRLRAAGRARRGTATGFTRRRPCARSARERR